MSEEGTFLDNYRSSKAQARSARSKKNNFRDKSKIVQKNVVERTTKNPKLQSNAFRYDENKEEDVSDTQDTSRDFRILSKASINQGHFQFKSDKALFDQEEHKTQNAFDMDLKLLSLSLSTIPFHLRHNIDIEYINKDDLENMELLVSMNKEKYSEYLLNKITKSKVSNQINKHINENISDFSNKTESNNKEISLTNKYSTIEMDKNKEELEDFLENLLDD